MYWGYFALYSTILHIILLIDLGFCLNKYLDQFETLAYKPVHDRRKREIVGNNRATIDVKFRSQIHNKTFHLKLRPVHQSKNIFDEKHAIDVDGIHHSHIIKPHEFIYEGVLEGDPHSTIYGTLHDGIFDGLITAGDGQTFTVEKASRYFGYDNRPLHYHSILYADQHINHGRFRTKRGDNEPEFSDETVLHGCGLSKKLHEEMRKFQESATEEPMTSRKFSYELDGERLQQLHSEEFLPFPDRYLNRTKRSEKPDWREIRTKRVYEVRTCTIYLQADHKLYEHIFHKEGNRDHIRTREEIVALLYTHIKAVNQIYEGTDFNGIRGINFAIKRTTIYTPETCIGERATTSGNPFCEDNVDVSNYLNMNSQKDHSAFCLAYSLTYRDFIGGTLGLAWVASPSQSTAGGICQKYQRYNEHQRGGVNRSLNTGIITLVNYGNRVPPRVSQLTLAHEIGHNFGSPHDFPLECQPGLPDGNFIMFASATSGDKPNNSKFSRCSVANISEVLFEVLAQSPKGYTPGRKKNCFTDQLKSFCGNQIKEDDEQCDCGFTAQDCQEMGDQCCTPREGASETTMCKRKPGRQCSPSEGLCCNPENCTYFEQHKKRKCREDSECQYEQFCDGRQPGCPQSANKVDGKPCQDNTKVCHSGNCNGSICAHYGLKDCFLTEGKPEDLCQLACEKNGICLPSASLPELAVANLVQEGRSAGHLLLPPGSPCNNYQGYCDIFRKCRSVDSNGPLARLKNLLFNREAIKEFTQLVKENWWACVLIGIVVLMLMALFVKCCAVHTPSTNPNKLPPANFSDTLRHPGTLLRRGHGHGPQHARPTSNGHRDRHGRTARAQCSANQVGREGAGNNANMAAATGAPRTARPTANPTNQIAETPLIQIGPAPLIPSAPLANILPSEPPPPYQLTDPAAAAPRPPLQPAAGPSSSQPPIQQHFSIPAIVGPPNPIAVPLPGAPPPAQPSSSILPLIPGPPHGQGPKPGRRKPKQSPQQQQLQQAKKAKDATGNEKRHNKRQAK